MKLIDLLELTYDFAEVHVYDNEGNEIACYDGKDSIPTFLNNKKVNGVYPKINRENGLPYIAIDLERR